jgi:glycolate oxidase FAD binding subunit
VPIVQPADAREVSEFVTWAAAASRPIELVGGGSMRGVGRPVRDSQLLDLCRISGIESYEPAELYLTARAATPLAEVEAVLSSAQQMLAFEPGDWRQLLGTPASTPTLAGALCCNLSGPRRIRVGTARDHLLGFRAVNGRGEPYKAGSRVVKNVTGFDLCKLMAGSYGTLSVLTEVTVKVLPRPDTECTVLVAGLDDQAAPSLLAQAVNSPNEVSGASYLSGAVAQVSAVNTVAGMGTRGGVAALRVEGPASSSAHRAAALTDLLSVYGPCEVLGPEDTAGLWRELRDVSLLAPAADGAVWRLSVIPSMSATIVAEIATHIPIRHFLDFAGGLVWAALPPGHADGGAQLIRRALAAHGGGHALLARAPEHIRASVSVFEPLAAPLAALTARVKDSFDPLRILNPGRMYADT